MSTTPGGGTTFRIPEQGPDAATCTDVGCELAALLTDPGVVTAIALAGLAAIVAFAYVRDAKECCREERRRVVDELDAFEEFADRVADLDPVAPDAPASALDGPVVGVQRGGGLASPGDVRVQRVVDAYEDTVLSLPHYQEEYDETATESLAAELGPDATASLTAGGALSPGLKSALVTRSRTAAESRSELVEAIDAEIQALETAEARLTEIDRGRRNLLDHLDGIPEDRRIDADIDVWQRLDDLEGRCDDLVEDRQAEIRSDGLTAAVGDDRDLPFQEYLYAPLSGTTYPVLAEASALADRIRSDRDRLVGRIAGAP